MSVRLVPAVRDHGAEVAGAFVVQGQERAHVPHGEDDVGDDSGPARAVAGDRLNDLDDDGQGDQEDDRHRREPEDQAHQGDDEREQEDHSDVLHPGQEQHERDRPDYDAQTQGRDHHDRVEEPEHGDAVVQHEVDGREDADGHEIAAAHREGEAALIVIAHESLLPAWLFPRGRSRAAAAEGSARPSAPCLRRGEVRRPH